MPAATRASSFAGGRSDRCGRGDLRDGAGRAHARRWTNRQSGYSAVRDTTRTALIVAEALHGSAAGDVPDLTAAIADLGGSASTVQATQALVAALRGR